MRDDAFCLVQFTPLTLQGGNAKTTIKRITCASLCKSRSDMNPDIRLFCSFSACLHWPPSYNDSYCRVYQGYRCYWPDWLDPVIKPPHSCRLCFTSVSFRLSPVLSSLSRIVQQHSDDVEETAQHFQSKVKHSHSQTYGAKRFNYWIIVLAILL